MLDIRVTFEWRDIWLGLFLDPMGRAAYICVVPMLPIIVRWGQARVWCQGMYSQPGGAIVVHRPGCGHVFIREKVRAARHV